MTYTPSDAILRVLIVDDEQPARTRMKKLLQPFVHDNRVQIVAEAHDGVEALEVLSSQAADLILLDIQMPGLLNGYDLSRVVAHRWPSVPVVLTSGNRAMASQLGASVRFLPKPWSTEHLLECVQTALTQQESSMH